MKRFLVFLLILIGLGFGGTEIYAQTTTQYNGSPEMPALFIKIVNLMKGHGFSSTTYTNSMSINSTYVNQNTNTNLSNINNSNANLRLQLNRLLIEHTSLATTDMQLVYQGVDNSHIRQLLNNNTNALADILNNAVQHSNPAATNGELQYNHDNFIRIWNQHIDDYEHYAAATKNNDLNGQQSAKNDLQSVSRQFALLFDTQGETPVPQNQDSDDRSLSLMTDHVNGSLSTFDNFVSNNYTGYTDGLQTGMSQAEVFADNLTSILTGLKI